MRLPYTFPSGAIITARIHKSLLLHKAIVFRDNGQLLLLHNTAKAQNEWGGNVIFDTPERFFASRTLLHCKPTKLTDAEIKAKYEQLKYRKFNVLTFNCEHFISLVTAQKKRSPQILFWSVFLTVIFMFSGKKIFNQ
jgi:hypothetical protein